MPKSRRPDPVTAAEADPAALLLAALPAPIPDYDPKVEITRADLHRRNNFSKAKAGIWLQAKVDSGEWTERQVMVNGRRATAYRPKAGA